MLGAARNLELEFGRAALAQMSHDRRMHCSRLLAGNEPAGDFGVRRGGDHGFRARAEIAAP